MSKKPPTKIIALIVLAVIIVAGIGVLLVQQLTPKPKPHLVIWGRATFVPPQMYWIEKKVREWASKNNVDVEITWYAVADIGKKLTAAVEAGNPPDIVINGHPVAIFAEKGLLLPLDDVIEKLNKSDFYEIKLKICSWGGHYYCVPMGFEMTWLHVRWDIVQKAGAQNLFPLKSLDDFYVAAKALHNVEPGVYGVGLPLGLNGYDTWWTFEHFWGGYGGAMLANRSVAGVIMDKEPYRSALKKAFEIERKIWVEKLTPPDSDQWVDASNNNAYIQGKIAMTINPASIYYALMTQNPELAAKTKLFVLPISVDCGDESTFIFKTTKYPDLAKDLVYYLFADKDDYRRGFVEAGALYFLPPFKSQMKVISSDWKKGKYPAFGEDPAVAVEKIKFMETAAFPLGERTTPSETFREGFIWNEMIQRVVVKGEDPDKVIDEYAARLREEVRRVYGG
ncbi:ABC transporter substrate-binding protein [Thermofilum pendens]|uniref:Extracellular solute-binding protein, family 1 n=1 Tax=Thermofilum pendens (strain DSM 2475 / Hrk 5) TaxID=368408 RepID=A1S0N4_THEPD|nr:ABC transporter substrate-binding protein [Thermofilum pendens]ABL79014.1 extracellular solute-binding protein, family 1 [Thermofilum pendens Hrk 5]